jgi:acyl-phosphate glycerol 3-phosphate acyltransferase
VPTLAVGWLARALQSNLAGEISRDELGVAAGLAAFLGHLFPIYLRFHGGKGVATGAGVVMVLLPGPGLVALVTWITLVAATRYVSLASIGAATALCICRLVGTPEPFSQAHRFLTLFCLAAMILVILRHHANIVRLLRGNENRLRDSAGMLNLAKIIHVMALGLWFGSAVFFTFVVGLILFNTFDKIGAQPQEERPLWFPLAVEFDQPSPSFTFPDLLRKEQGRRAAGAAVTPMFAWYFGIQGTCAVLALAMSLSWSGKLGRVHRLRKLVLAAALGGVIGGWFLEGKVDGLRAVRNDASDKALVAGPTMTLKVRQTARAAREDFAEWHTYSLLVNLLTLVLVTVAMGMAGVLPAAGSPAPVASPKQELLPLPEDGR